MFVKQLEERFPFQPTDGVLRNVAVNLTSIVLSASFEERRIPLQLHPRTPKNCDASFPAEARLPIAHPRST